MGFSGVPVEEPDIAFWFDEDDRYLVRIREDITHVQLIQAYFDLLVKAIKADPGTVEGTFRKEVEKRD